MIKKTILAAAIGLLALPAVGIAAGDMGQGTITFSGSVTEAPCSISTGDNDMTIDLGQVSKNMLNAPGKFSDSVPIEIHLAGCQFAQDTGANANPAGRLSKVGVQFLGAITNAALGKITNAGTATSVAVQLLDSDNLSPITIGAAPTAANAVQLRDGSNVLRYFARLSVVGGPGPAASGTGSISASATYSLTYF